MNARNRIFAVEYPLGKDISIMIKPFTPAYAAIHLNHDLSDHGSSGVAMPHASNVFTVFYAAMPSPP
jgi:hypothetical protein